MVFGYTAFSKPCFIFNGKYFLLFCAVFVLEFSIATWVTDNYIRPYLGDFLIVILLYFFCKSFTYFSPTKAALYTLLISCSIETAQYFGLIYLLKLEHSTLAKCILGTTFQWMDFVMYFSGTGTVLMWEYFRGIPLKHIDKSNLQY